MSALGLGRRPSRKDERDRRFLLQRKPAEPRKRLWYVPPPVLDQGATAQCVAYSGTNYLTAAPVMNRPSIEPVELYRRCLAIDEYPGEDMDGGTSVRALFQVLRGLGYVSEYRWAWDADTLINHVLTTGPAVVGTPWHRDMFTPHNLTNYITPTGPDDGGHAWLIIGADKWRWNPDWSFGAILMLNSWGPGWGDNGRAWMSFRDLRRLMAADSEGCVATEVAPQGG